MIRHVFYWSDAFRFIEAVPVNWSESRYIEAEPGEYITVARREKNTRNWYVGGKTAAPRKTALKLDFLEKGVKYQLTLWKDAPGAHWESAPDQFEVSRRVVKAGQTLAIDMACGGGFALQLIPLDK